MSKVKNFDPVLNQTETKKKAKMVIDLIPNWCSKNACEFITWYEDDCFIIRADEAEKLSAVHEFCHVDLKRRYAINNIMGNIFLLKKRGICWSTVQIKSSRRL